MDNLKEEATYEFIIKHFGEDRIKSRYIWLYDLMQDYLEKEKLQNSIFISEDILDHVIIDYFVDIYSVC